jgi:fermentation-respiration switch protein FrsA (DUF1100 family)
VRTTHPDAIRSSSRSTAAVAALVALLLSAACSTTEDRTQAAPTTAPPTGSATTASPVPAAVEEFEGSVEDFYQVPDPLSPGEPGELIRTMEVDPTAPGTTTVRVMYHSIDGADRDRAVTGTFTYPNAPAPDGGWPILSWAHGTTGLAPPCAPSRSPGQPPAFGVEGIVVATDYIGLGPVGERHAYLSRASEGHSVLDAARGARNLLGDDASNRLLVAGHSQGGHGALAAHELATTYAPELELLGTIAFAPAAVFGETFGPLDTVVSQIVGVMGLYGVATEEPELDPSEYLTDVAEEAATTIETGCLSEITDAFVAILGQPYFDTDPMTTEPARSIMLANDVGRAHADAPLLLINGTADDRVVLARTEALFERLCSNRQTTEFIVVDGANHGDVIPRTADRTAAWFTDRLAGATPTDSCPAAS